MLQAVRDAHRQEVLTGFSPRRCRAIDHSYDPRCWQRWLLVRRFFVALLWPTARRLASVLHWSNWRRNHQAQAKFFHYKTRKALRHLQL